MTCWQVKCQSCKGGSFDSYLCCCTEEKFQRVLWKNLIKIPLLLLPGCLPLHPKLWGFPLSSFSALLLISVCLPSLYYRKYLIVITCHRLVLSLKILFATLTQFHPLNWINTITLQIWFPQWDILTAETIQYFRSHFDCSATFLVWKLSIGDSVALQYISCFLNIALQQF